ncbi:MAG: ABC transporter ATP-binding protein [Planctomycetes bacterium]|nr:ABC transporter ATP-binding protein [Planctomycetota bacterium]
MPGQTGHAERRSPPKVSLGRALQRFGPYVWRYRARATLVLFLGLLTGVLVKAPFFFLAPFIDSILELKAGGAGAETAKSAVLARLDEALRAWLPAIADLLRSVSAAPTDMEKGEKTALLVAIAGGVVVFTLLGALCQYAFQAASRSLSLRILADLRQDLASHILRLGMQYHTSARKGDLLSRATTDVGIVLTALALFFDDLILEPAQLLGNVVLALVGDAKLTILVLVLVPIVGIPLAIFGRRVRKGARKSLAALGESTEAMSQMFAGIRVVKAFRMEERELQEFRETNERWIDRSMTVVRAKALTESSTHLLTNAGFALLICGIGLAHLQWGVLAGIGSMSVWFVGFATMYQHIRRISKGYQTVQESLGAAERLFEIFDIRPAAATQPSGRRRLDGPIREVELRDVSFAYDQEPVLDHVSFRIEAGETIAVVGPSGAGKSTLLDLVARFYDPQSGAILVNGIDVRELAPDAWFAAWALVDQQPFLFHASIRENVAYGKPNATDAEVRAALGAANLLEFVESLPAGIHTEVGDRGARLSGGQRQRLTIARALLKNPPILLLDEATSSLDSESEAAVRDALEKLMVGRTSLVVAHRLSTVRNASRLLVVDRGRIVEMGTHDQLLATGGVYRRLHDMQFGANAVAQRAGESAS